ncbi:MAG TPA: hypothetical protein VF776_00890 [Sphingomicrobium sp.]
MIRQSLLLCCAMLTAAAPISSAASAPLSDSTQKDVQCFILFAAATDRAATADDGKAKEAATLGIMYYIGKLAVDAPGLNLVDAVRQQASVMEGNSQLKQIGESCDAEFAKRGSELRDVGTQLQKPSP